MKTRTRLLLLFEAVLLAGLITIGVIRGDPLAQFGELRLGTFVSVVQLLVVAWIAFRIWRIRWGAEACPSWKSAAFIWLLMSFGFAYLAADELWEVHESIDFTVHRVFHMRETAWSDRIDDLLIGLYGCAGIAALIAYRRELMRYRPVLPLVLSGFGMFFVMVVIDAATNRADLLDSIFHRDCSVLHTWLAVTEDCIKLGAEAVFILAFYASFEVARHLAQTSPFGLADGTKVEPPPAQQRRPGAERKL